MSFLHFFLPSSYLDYTPASARPLRRLVGASLRAVYNIAFASLAIFAIAGSAACAVRLIFSN